MCSTTQNSVAQAVLKLVMWWGEPWASLLVCVWACHFVYAESEGSVWLSVCSTLLDSLPVSVLRTPGWLAGAILLSLSPTDVQLCTWVQDKPEDQTCMTSAFCSLSQLPGLSVNTSPFPFFAHWWFTWGVPVWVSDPLELELQLWASAWLLRSEPGSSQRVASALNHWHNPPALTVNFWFSCSYLLSAVISSVHSFMLCLGSSPFLCPLFLVQFFFFPDRVLLCSTVWSETCCADQAGFTLAVQCLGNSLSFGSLCGGIYHFSSGPLMCCLPWSKYLILSEVSSHCSPLLILSPLSLGPADLICPLVCLR